jgi:hypothetical protein
MAATPEEELERDRKYAWDYFLLHSSQRIATFNFYITLATVVLVGISAPLQLTPKMPVLSFALSVVLALISFVFYKLDQRNKMLIKTSENALKDIERLLHPSHHTIPNISLFLADEQAVKSRREHPPKLFWNRHFSYSNCFNLIFLLFGILSGVGMIYSVVVR